VAPIGLACPHGEEEGSALVRGIGLRLWLSALGFPSLAFIYKSIVFHLFGLTDNSSSSLLLNHLLVSTACPANITIIEPGLETYKAAMEAEDSDQCIKVIGKEVTSVDNHEVFTFMQKVPEGASIIQSRWVMGKKLLANEQNDKWQVRLVDRGDRQKPGNYNNINSPVINSVSSWLALGLAANYDLKIALVYIPNGFLGFPLYNTPSMRLPDGEWPDPDGRARPLLYSIRPSASSNRRTGNNARK